MTEAVLQPVTGVIVNSGHRQSEEPRSLGHHLSVLERLFAIKAVGAVAKIPCTLIKLKSFKTVSRQGEAGC